MNVAVVDRKQLGHKPSLIRSHEDLQKEDYIRYCEMSRRKILEIYGTTRWSQKEAIRRQEEEAEKNWEYSQGLKGAGSLQARVAR